MTSFRLYQFLIAITMMGGFITLSSCFKEFSQEGVLQDTTQIPTPPAPPLTPGFSLPTCPYCLPDNRIGLGKWSFKIDTSYYCGNLTRAVIAPGRVVFTFFGPTACASDTGLIMTVYLNNGDALDGDKQNIVTEKAVFQYYAQGRPDILSNPPLPGFKLTISQYNHTTREATGVFAGIVYTANAKRIDIKEGRFVLVFE